MGIGRPEVWNKEEQAKLILEWSKKDDSINLMAFCNDQEFPAEYLSRWAKDSETFCQALKVSKQRIAARREKMLNEGKLHNSAWQRCASLYDAQLHMHERAEKEFEHNLKMKQIEQEAKNMCDLKKEMADGKLQQK